ncbi:MAG TPA: type II 3-dehydroquinate dehydratase [Candidatus Binataceae bacterium]|nr:type II 3-dehydroquinate dehydratase [Candidatus Binataceae bacterium]
MATKRKGIPAQRSSAGLAAGEKLRVLVIHGPNLNLLGEREPEIYGRTRLSDIDAELARLGEEIGISVECFQSNSEGDIVTRLQGARGKFDALLINPAAYTHTSVAIRDAVLALNIPSIEVHLSNVYRREPLRHRSMIADIVEARLMGFGAESYYLGLRAVRGIVAAHARKSGLAARPTPS